MTSSTIGDVYKSAASAPAGARDRRSRKVDSIQGEATNQGLSPPAVVNASGENPPRPQTTAAYPHSLAQVSGARPLRTHPPQSRPPTAAAEALQPTGLRLAPLPWLQVSLRRVHQRTNRHHRRQRGCPPLGHRTPSSRPRTAPAQRRGHQTGPPRRRRGRQHSA